MNSYKNYIGNSSVIALQKEIKCNQSVSTLQYVSDITRVLKIERNNLGYEQFNFFYGESNSNLKILAQKPMNE